MMFTIPTEGPLDASRTLARYYLWGEDPATPIGANSLGRVLRWGDRLYAYEVTWQGGPDGTELTVAVPAAAAPAILAAVGREVEQIFGLGADLPGFYRMAKGEPGLREFIEPLYGLRPTLTPAPLEMLVGSICAQQVNLAFAFATRARLIRRYGTPVPLSGRTLYAFPDAGTLARARVETLRRLQFSGRKAEYLVGVARAIVEGRLDLAGLAACANDEAIARLTALRGVGRWSAEWFLARCLGRGDVCPAGDLAVRKAFAATYNRGRPLSDAAIRRRAGRWGPYQNLAVHYLLAGLRVRQAVGGGA